MPTSASDIRQADVTPVALRRRTRAHTASAANGSAATVMSATPLNVPTQTCHPGLRIGMDNIFSTASTGPNAAIATPRIARLTSTILRVRRTGADSDALWSMPAFEDGRLYRGRMRFDALG
jgi:hypothetical protein